MKKALVLAGGGTRGIYQLGVLEALHELGEDHFDLVIGVSVGALNALFIAQNDIDVMTQMYENLTSDQIVNGYVPNDLSIKTLFNDRQEVMPQIQYYLKEHGIDVHPFYDMVDKYYNPEKLQNSSIDFGCVAALKKDHSGVYVNKQMMKEHGREWLIATASAYPAFPVCTIDGVEYVDGGYFDNFPIDYALQQGADRIIGIDLNPEPLHPLYIGKDMIHYIHPHVELYSFLDFNHEAMQHAKKLGYYDAMKEYGRYCGQRFTFEPFVLPTWFETYMRELLMLETRIKLATGVNERFRSQSVISDKLKQQLHLEYLSTRNYFYGTLDGIMDMLNFDDTKLYQYSEVEEKIMAEFADCAKEDYPYRPALTPAEIAGYIRSLEPKSVLKTMIHGLLYPEHRFIPENVVLTVYPNETGYALFIALLLKGRKGE